MKYISFVRYGLIAISLVILFLFLGTMNQTTGVYPYIDLLMRWTYVMLFISVGAVILLPIFEMAKNPQGAKRTLIGVGILVLVIAISYALSDGSPVTSPSRVYENAMEVRLSDTGLIATYIALAGAVAAIVVGELVKLFRK